MTNQPRTAAGRALLAANEDWDIVDYAGDLHGLALIDQSEVIRLHILAIEAEAAVPLDDLIEKARDWRYSDGWIGATFRDRLASTDEEGTA